MTSPHGKGVCEQHFSINISTEQGGFAMACHRLCSLVGFFFSLKLLKKKVMFASCHLVDNVSIMSEVG